jgi:hypothetical protein
MSELNRDGGLRMLAHRSHDRPQRRLGGVIPQAEASRRDAAGRFHRRGLDAEYRRTRQRQRVDVREVPVSGLAVFGGILAHRRHHDAVGKREITQLERRKQNAHVAFSWGFPGDFPGEFRAGGRTALV